LNRWQLPEAIRLDVAVYHDMAGLYGQCVLQESVRPGKPSIIGHVLQFGLLVMAILWAARLGLFSRWLWSPVDIVVGLILGHLLFSFSLLITHQHAGDVLRHSLDVRGITAFLKVSPELVFRFAGVCIIEELVYRAAAQDILAPETGTSPARHCYHRIVLLCAPSALLQERLGMRRRVFPVFTDHRRGILLDLQSDHRGAGTSDAQP
jgi:hypothetical protein